MTKRLPGKRLERIDLRIGDGSFVKTVDVRYVNGYFYCVCGDFKTAEYKTRDESLGEAQKHVNKMVAVTWAHYLDINCRDKFFAVDNTHQRNCGIQIGMDHVICSTELFDGMRLIVYSLAGHRMNDNHGDSVVDEWVYPDVPANGIQDVHYGNYRPDGTLIPYTPEAEKTIVSIIDMVNNSRKVMDVLLKCNPAEIVKKLSEGSAKLLTGEQKE